MHQLHVLRMQEVQRPVPVDGENTRRTQRQVPRVQRVHHGRAEAHRKPSERIEARAQLPPGVRSRAAHETHEGAVHPDVHHTQRAPQIEAVLRSRDPVLRGRQPDLDPQLPGVPARGQKTTGIGHHVARGSGPQALLEPRQDLRRIFRGCDAAREPPLRVPERDAGGQQETQIQPLRGQSQGQAEEESARSCQQVGSGRVGSRV
mmetsp:Transcript_5844/g.20477  ORF Transcript_5844/g.20477 Transcript_5844/m.20477 type:complete len:204 (+) Transcript_5844:561-1172(+)